MATWNFEFGIPAGQPGADGTNGTDGVDGKSAYQIWLDQGNTGTEQDFLDSIATEAVDQITFTATATALPAGSTPTVTVTES